MLSTVKGVITAVQQLRVINQRD